MKQKEKRYNDIFNYKNSRYFIETVREARRFEREQDADLVIFAGACESYFEALIMAGANFASSPARIMIDFLDPLVIAKKIATTDSIDYITMGDLENELRDGRRGVGRNWSKSEKRKKQILHSCNKNVTKM